jgi:hypothetical protein
MIRLHSGLCEDLTRRLPCQQSDEREHRLVGVSIDMRPMTGATGDIARSRSASSARPVP